MADGVSQRFFVKDVFTIGSSPDVNFYVDGNLEPIQCIFQANGDVLSLYNEGEKRSFIGRQELEKDKTYVMDVGDRLILQDRETVIVDIGREGGFKRVKPSGMNDFHLEKEIDLPKDAAAPLEITRYEVDKEEFIDRKASNLQLEKEIKTSETVSRAREKENKTAVHKEITLNKRSGGVDPFTRFYALLVNICLVYGMVTYLIPQIPFYSAWNRLIAMDVIPLMERITGLFPPVLLTMAKDILSVLTSVGLVGFFISFVVYDLFFHLLLGVSLPYFLTGMRTDGGFIVSRLKGTIRSLIGNFTFFLILFDLPALTGSRTFKEVVTFTRFERISGIRRMFSWLLLFPCLVFVGLYSPFLHDLSQLTGGFPMGRLQNKDRELSRKLEDPNRPINTTAYSSVLGLVLQDNLSDDFTLIPGLKKIDEADVPYVAVAGKTQKFITHWRAGEEFSFDLFLDKARQGNPLFSTIFPLLDERIEKGSNGDFSFDEQRELRSLFDMVLHLDGKNFFFLVSRYGPFIDGYVKAKLYLISLLDLSPNRHKIDFSFSRQAFWFNAYSLSGESMNSRVISFTKPKSLIWSFDYGRDSREFFQDKLLPWLQKNQRFGQKNLQGKSNSSFNAFSLFDYLHLEKGSAPSKKLLNDLIAYYRRNIVDARKNSQADILREWKNSLQAVNAYFKDINPHKIQQIKLDRLYRLIDKR
ncbi:MAG: hypothetical protein OXB84_02045 [Halobacteriovoraceae bacterium]|nr:hypothetical protein [Halobacteriovoraceae bacterium]